MTAATQVRLAAPTWLVVLCVLGYLACSLQQVVIGHSLGVGLSLGSMLLRLFAAGIALWALARHGVPRPLRLPGLAIVACALALGLSVLASEHADIASRHALRYGLELLLLWAVLNLALAWPACLLAAAQAALIVLWLGLALAVAVALDLPQAKSLSLVFHAADTFKYLPRVSGFYEHPALLAASGVLVALLATQLQREGYWSRRRWLAALSGALLALLLSGARNPLLALLALLGLWLWQRRGAAHAWRLGLAALLGVSLLLGGAIASRYAEITSASREGFLTAFSLGRTYLWAGAFEAWRSHPWFGLGAGVYQYLVPDYTGGRFDRGELHAHNLVLGVLSETGLVGLLACLFLLYALWRPWLSQRGAPGRGWALAWLLALLSLGLFDFYLPFYSFTLHAALAVALLYALYPGARGGAMPGP